MQDGVGHAGREVSLRHIKWRHEEESWMTMSGTQKPGLCERGKRTQDRVRTSTTGGPAGAELDRRLRKSSQRGGRTRKARVMEALGERVSKRKAWPVVRYS